MDSPIHYLETGAVRLRIKFLICQDRTSRLGREQIFKSSGVCV